MCLNLNATESPIGDPGSVGGLHHACRVDLVAVETGKVISCAVAPRVSSYRALGNRISVHGSVLQAVNNAHCFVRIQVKLAETKM